MVHFAGFLSFGLSILISRSLKTTTAIGYNTETNVDSFPQFEKSISCWVSQSHHLGPFQFELHHQVGFSSDAGVSENGTIKC